MALELAPGLPVRPLSLEEYEQMVEFGILDEDSRVELLDGVLVEVSPQGDLQAAILEYLTEWACDNVDRVRLRIRCQLPLRLPPASSPEPDLVLVARGARSIKHPDTATLAVEVAISSLVKDLDVKRRLYAEARVGEYWVVLPAERRIRVHSEPTGSDYAHVDDVERAVFEGAEFDLPRLLDGFEDANRPAERRR